MQIADNIAEIRTCIERAVANRKSTLANESKYVKLVAVTKNHSVQAMQAAIDAGVPSIGENRVQEAAGKYPVLSRQAEWHLIGHLQTNKAHLAVEMFDLIHSVDSDRLARELDKAAAKAGKIQEVLLQVNIAGEETKFGIAPEDVLSLAQYVCTLKSLRLAGLMTIAPYEEDAEKTRPVFQQAMELFQDLRRQNLPTAEIRWLSMGMTNDYRVAVEEGANIVRIGTGIFGARQYE